MKSINATSTRVLIQLKLEAGVPNNFEFCEARLPLPSRRIASIDGSPTSGTLAVASSRREVVWTLGHKWKSREIAAPATITFEAEDAATAANEGADDEKGVEVRDWV